LTSEGVDFVFNTPNDQSRPGYLKMGWQVLGRVPVRARPTSLGGLVRMAKARTPADLWSTPSTLGVAATEAFADDEGLAALLASQPSDVRLRTRRSSAFLRWRYGGFPPLGYRVITAGPDAASGFAVFRLRRRGRALEAAIGDVVAPGADRRVIARLLGQVGSRSGADYAVRLGDPPPPAGGFLPLPRQGPLVTWRALAQIAPVPFAQWRLSIGDIELF
jgi:hypothetical protein